MHIISGSKQHLYRDLYGIFFKAEAQAGKESKVNI